MAMIGISNAKQKTRRSQAECVIAERICCLLETKRISCVALPDPHCVSDQRWHSFSLMELGRKNKGNDQSSRISPTQGSWLCNNSRDGAMFERRPFAAFRQMESCFC